jgi:hypothetical protein
MRSHIFLGFKLTSHHHHYNQRKYTQYIYIFSIFFSSKDDHARIQLTNSGDDDYINASTIVC